jgi:hypothetical protein
MGMGMGRRGTLVVEEGEVGGGALKGPYDVLAAAAAAALFGGLLGVRGGGLLCLSLHGKAEESSEGAASRLTHCRVRSAHVLHHHHSSLSVVIHHYSSSRRRHVRSARATRSLLLGRRRRKNTRDAHAHGIHAIR